MECLVLTRFFGGSQWRKRTDGSCKTCLGLNRCGGILYELFQLLPYKIMGVEF